MFPDKARLTVPVEGTYVDFWFSQNTHLSSLTLHPTEHDEKLNIKEKKGIHGLWTYVESEWRSNVPARIGKTYSKIHSLATARRPW